jgi:hypothetical protein
MAIRRPTWSALVRSNSGSGLPLWLYCNGQTLMWINTKRIPQLSMVVGSGARQAVMTFRTISEN